jgi:hypothetical protein
MEHHEIMETFELWGVTAEKVGTQLMADRRASS